MSDAAESGMKSLGIFSTLQSATEMKFFLLAMAFVLLIDDVFVQFNQPSLFDLVINKDLMTASNFGLKVVLIFVVFSFLTSLVLRVAVGVVIGIYDFAALRIKWLSNDILDSIFPSSKNSLPIRERDSVSRYELYVEAHETKDSYLLNMYAEYQKSVNETRALATQHAIFAFYCLVMLAWNFVISTPENRALSSLAFEYFPLALINVLILSLFGFIFYNIHIIVNTYRKRDWIYCPTLAKTLVAKEKEHLKKFERPQE